MPISVVLARDEIMLTIKPGQHGSTYGGNPLACAVGMEALKVLKEEKLAENAHNMGNLFRSKVSAIKSPLLGIVRGKGLLNAITINNIGVKKGKAWEVCLKMRDLGLLAKPTHDNIIRLAPPLVINEQQVLESVSIIEKSLKEVEATSK